MHANHQVHDAHPGIMPVSVGLLLTALLCLAGCGQPPVRFFSEGQPPTLDEWHVLQVNNGILSLNAGVVAYDLIGCPLNKW